MNIRNLDNIDDFREFLTYPKCSLSIIITLLESDIMKQHIALFVKSRNYYFVHQSGKNK